MTRKLYTGPLVNVSFDLEICQHSGNCVRGMPSVFDTSKRPWIDPENADTPELAQHLRETIWTCPSGALRVVEHRGRPTPVDIDPGETAHVTSVETTEGGEPPVEGVDQP
jgi:uncharacterized Fe-S cluster protein YjdI